MAITLFTVSEQHVSCCLGCFPRILNAEHNIILFALSLHLTITDRQ